jgi:hypothetical protein
MDALLAAYVVVVMLIAKSIGDLYQGSRYACPSCGTKRQNSHSADCPWKPPND